MKTFNSHNAILDYQVKDGMLTYSGVWKYNSTWISHSFQRDSICLMKDKRSYTNKKAQVIKITEDFVTLKILGNKTNSKVSIEEFISTNFTLKTLIRLEYNNKGLYCASDLPTVILEMIEKHKAESINGERRNQPVPNMYSASETIELRKHWKFAFYSHEQLFRWFTLAEISLLMKNNVKIVELQEFKDFQQTMGSAEQTIYTQSTESKLWNVF